jgi:ribosomal protein S18 acetylase RimI-like enzyme
VTTIAYTVHDEAVRNDANVVDAGLGDYNDQAAPLHEVRPLQAFARLPDGTVIGGAVGRTWGPACELLQLWVHADHRKQGVGRRLVQEFERRAASRGCRTFYLETLDFQAPDFYRSLGYEVAHEHRWLPHGIVKYVMVRED